jgi:4-diphosphocytidyl-2-C-methyl-D-erythritol kinase
VKKSVDQLVLYPPAKINLHLRVLNRRPDGYHNLETIFVAVDLRDELKLRRTTGGGIYLRVENGGVPKDSSNLCYRAAALFLKEGGAKGAVEITLKKQIPAGAGLGGGSSDAAFTLCGLNKLFGKPLTEKQLHKMAAGLGADVAFFLRPGVAIGRGIGDQLEYIDVNWKFHVVLVWPNLKISTRWAYEELKIGLTADENYRILDSRILRGLDPHEFSNVFLNDFEPVVFEAYPRIAEIKTSLRRLGAFFAAMSGTGSAVFGLFDEEKKAHEAAEFFYDQADVWVVRPVLSSEW